MNVTDKDREEAEKICDFYGIYAEPNTLKRLAETVARFRAEAKKEAAEKAVAFVDNNYNAFGEWDCVAFDNLRAAILLDSPVKENLKSDAEKLATAIQYLEEITKRNDSHECYRLANEALREIQK